MAKQRKRIVRAVNAQLSFLIINYMAGFLRLHDEYVKKIIIECLNG